jgi:hypothetical protein
VSCADDLHAIAVNVTAATVVAARAAGDKVREEALNQARTAAGGDLLLTGKKKRGIPLDVTVTDMAQPDGGRVRLAGTPAGVWRWIDTGTKPHQIHRRKKGNKSKVFAQHPGTTGKKAWIHTVEAAPDIARSAALGAIIEAVTA